MHETKGIDPFYIYEIVSDWLEKASNATKFIFLNKISSYGRLIKSIVVEYGKELCVPSTHCSWHIQNIHATAHPA